jgi:hypothetical protein
MYPDALVYGPSTRFVHLNIYVPKVHPGPFGCCLKPYRFLQRPMSHVLTKAVRVRASPLLMGQPIMAQAPPVPSLTSSPALPPSL